MALGQRLWVMAGAGTGGDVLKQWGRGSCQRWVELQLEPTARSLFSTGNSSWPQRFLWDDQLAVGVAHSRY